MQMQDDTDIVIALLVLPDDLFVVSVHQEGQDHPVCAKGGLDDIGDIVLVLGLVVVGQIDSPEVFWCWLRS